jgi:heptosyltransferase III
MGVLSKSAEKCIICGDPNRQIPASELHSDMAEKVVIYRLGTLGDTIVALPCFHLIARAFPNAARIILTNEVPSSAIAQPLSILSGSGLVQDSIAYPLGLRSPYRLLTLARTLRSLGADTLIYLTESKGIARTFRDVAFFRFAGFTRIIGAPLSRDLTYNQVDPVSGIAEQEPLRLGRTLHELGTIDFDDPNVWSLNLTDSEHRAAAPFVQAAGCAPIIAINHGGKVVKNDWGEERWRAFLSLLGREFGNHVLAILGSTTDHSRAERLTQFWPGLTLNLCGCLAARESAAFLKSVSLFVGHDSGPLHLASACQIPTVGLFGNNKPAAIWHPYGAHNTVVRAEAGLQAITPDEVFRAVCARCNETDKLIHQAVRAD